MKDLMNLKKELHNVVVAAETVQKTKGIIRGYYFTTDNANLTASLNLIVSPYDDTEDKIHTITFFNRKE